MDLSTAILSEHAVKQLSRRAIERESVMLVLKNPESVEPVRPGRVVLQAMIEEVHLLRVFVDIDREPAEIVTAYVTSKIEKYRKPSTPPASPTSPTE